MSLPTKPTKISGQVKDRHISQATFILYVTNCGPYAIKTANEQDLAFPGTIGYPDEASLTKGWLLTLQLINLAQQISQVKTVEELGQKYPFLMVQAFTEMGQAEIQGKGKNSIKGQTGGMVIVPETAHTGMWSAIQYCYEYYNLVDNRASTNLNSDKKQQRCTNTQVKIFDASEYITQSSGSTVDLHRMRTRMFHSLVHSFHSTPDVDLMGLVESAVAKGDVDLQRQITICLLRAFDLLNWSVSQKDQDGWWMSPLYFENESTRAVSVRAMADHLAELFQHYNVDLQKICGYIGTEGEVKEKGEGEGEVSNSSVNSSGARHES